MWRELVQDWEIVMHSVAWIANRTVRIPKGVPRKPKGKMPIHAFLCEDMLGGTYTEKSRDPGEL